MFFTLSIHNLSPYPLSPCDSREGVISLHPLSQFMNSADVQLCRIIHSQHEDDGL